MSISIQEAKIKINDILDSIDSLSITDTSDKSNSDAHLLMKMFPVGGCIVPTDIDQLPSLSLPNHKFQAPKTVDLRDYCTPPTNQGQLPRCAGHAAVSFAENVLWRKNDYYEDISPDKIYLEAKKIDGNPNGDGTTLTAVMNVLLNLGYFDKNICSIKVIKNYDDYENKLKYAIHKFGCLLVALNISEEFYYINKNTATITGTKNTNKLGGHALCCCGMFPDGIIIQNSWGGTWGKHGFALVTWEALKSQFLYATVLENCLDGMKMN